MVVSDNGTELTSNAILTWVDQSRVAWHYIAPGKPMQNAFIESFNPAAGRTAQRDAVHVTGPGPRRARMLADRLQRRTTTLAAWMENAVRVRLHLPSATRSGAALCRGLRASSRRRRPTGQIQQPARTQDWIKLGGKVTANSRRKNSMCGVTPIAWNWTSPGRASHETLRKIGAMKSWAHISL